MWKVNIHLFVLFTKLCATRPAGCCLVARSAYYVPVPANVNVRLSVRPSVRVCVCPCVCPCVTDFWDFCEGHMDSVHPQIPFAKRALWCRQTHLKIYPRILGLKSKFSDHFFDKKRVFTKKVPSFTRCKNFCTKSIDNHQKYTFAWCLRHTTCDEINYSDQSQIINFEK